MVAQAHSDLNRANPQTGDPRRTAAPALPQMHSSFVGREREIDTLRQMVRNPALRLITITGPGGVGKTRLSIEVAATLERSFGRHIWFVPLAPVGNSSLVPAAIARTIGVRESGSRGIVQDIIEYLAPLRALLLVDNFERVIDAGGVISELLTACPELTVVVTSQAPLRLRGEQELGLTPLVPPSVEAQMRPDGIEAAMQLFVDRARAVQPDFALNESNRDAVEAICRAVDGLPLAIELAAARVRLLSPASINTRLRSDRQAQFHLLSGGPRDVPERHQSLGGAIGWSYRLLDPTEQMLFRRLSVFRGWFTLAAAESVCDFGAMQEQSPDIFELVASLVDKSLLMSQTSHGQEPSFLMLASIRAYAAELLDADEEHDAVRELHASYFMERAVAAEMGLRGAEQRAWLDRLDIDHANLLAALRWLDDAKDGARLQRMVWALFWYWFYRGNTQEARHWLQRACSYEDAGATDADLWVRVGDSMLTNHVGLHEEAVRKATAAATLARERGKPIMESVALTIAQYGALALGRLEESTGYGWEAYRLIEPVDDDYWRAMVYGEAGLFLGGAGELSDGLALVEAGLELDRARGDDYFAGIRLSDIGVMRHDLGELDVALARYGESIDALSRVGGVWYLSSPFGGIAALSAETYPEEAARLLGAARALQDRGGANPWSTEIARNALALERARTALGEPAFERAFRRGYRMQVEEAIDIARSLVAQGAASVGSWSELSSALTPRELEVLELIGAGLSDKEIGEALSISSRTASKHVANILGKLGVSSRSAAAALAMKA
jgi:predicted ATPase/DNA-binding CsgD family transcriptional regulator